MHEINQVCEEKRKFFDEMLETHNIRLNDHSERLKQLEKESSEYRTDIRNLIKKMDDLMNTIKWGLGFFAVVAGVLVTIMK